MNNFTVEDDHVQLAAEYTNQIDVEGVTVYAKGYHGFGIEVTMDTPDGWGLLGDYTFDDEAELQSVVNGLGEELTKHESFGFDRNDQQLYIAGVLDDYVGVRDQLIRRLQLEFWPFLASNPHNPDLFWGGAADRIVGELNLGAEYQR